MQKCKIHAAPDNNVQEVYALLVQHLPVKHVWCELPLLSEGKQGRARHTGQFLGNKQGDLRVDLVVQAHNDLLYGVEVCGKHNRTEDGKQRAVKKERVSTKLGLPVCWLWAHEKHKWPRQIDDMRVYLSV